MGKKETFEYQTEMKQLLDLIIHSLYTHPEVFLRELISNASDALNKIRFKQLTNNDILDKDADLKITITADKDKKILTIEDSGIGMNKDALINNIGTIARSGTKEFLSQIKNSDTGRAGSLIGQFGVGFYSVFMVTDEVTIETRSADSDSAGYIWKSRGEGNFTIEETDKKTRGTKISFKLKKEHEEFADDWRLKEIIKKYSNFADFPIYFGEEKVNTVEALWQKPAKNITDEELNEFYKFIGNDYQEPLDHLHISLEGAVNFKALIFIPQNAPMNMLQFHEAKSLNLYSNRILIQEDCRDLLPEYLRFFKGVVDTSDLPLNVSREVTQNSPAMSKIRQTLISKILKHLDRMAEKEPEKFKKFYQNFGPLLKSGVNSDFTNRDKIIDMMRFETTQTEAEQMITLREYIARSKPDQKEIYYISGEDKGSLLRNPNLEYFKKNNVEVLVLSEPIDVFIVPSIPEYDKKPLKSIEASDLDLMKKDEKKIETPDDKLSQGLLDIFKNRLRDKVEDVKISNRLVDSPATLVKGEKGMDTQMERMMKMMDKNFEGSKKVLEINMDHPLIRNLSALSLGDQNDPLLDACVEQIYESSLLLEGNLKSPADYVKRMVTLMEKATA